MWVWVGNLSLPAHLLKLRRLFNISTLTDLSQVRQKCQYTYVSEEGEAHNRSWYWSLNILVISHVQEYLQEHMKGEFPFPLCSHQLLSQWSADMACPPQVELWTRAGSTTGVWDTIHCTASAISKLRRFSSKSRAHCHYFQVLTL